MKTGKFGLNVFVERAFYKIKGKVYDMPIIHEWGSSIKIYKGTGKSRKVYQFTSSDKGMFDGLGSDDRIEVLFRIVCKDSRRMNEDKSTKGLLITWLVAVEWKVWHGGSTKYKPKKLL
jgi:hypothetical protein